MKTYILALTFILAGFCSAQDKLGRQLTASYEYWRQAIIAKDSRAWQSVTAPHRQVEVRNRIVSQKLPFPASVFNLPAPPPSVKGLELLQAKKNGRTAKAAYFGKVDFGTGPSPTKNLLVLSFVRGERNWMYDRADVVSLSALPDVRKELESGDLTYLDGVPEAQPSGSVPPTPVSVGPASTIAKVYVFCPGREVQVQVNKVSRHTFTNAKDADIVIGGARNGLNEVQYSIRKIEGGTGEEALTIRVYLMSEVQGVKPIKIFEYQVLEKEPLKPLDTRTFVVDGAVLARLAGK